MKELKKSLLYVFIFQIICWGIFILCDEFPYLSMDNAEFLAMNVGVILLTITLVLYFVFERKIIKKHNLNSKKFNISLIMLWILFAVVGTLSTSYLVDKGILHYCESRADSSFLVCFLNGIEYILYGFSMIFQSIIVILWKIVLSIYKYFSKK